MLYYLLALWTDKIGFFRVFRYPSFRVPASALTALGLTLWLFPQFIEWLRRTQQGETQVREWTPQSHQKKNGTPTMGGLFILISVAVCTLLWSDVTNPFIWAVMAVMGGFGAIGFVDDWRKVTRKSSAGLAGRRKLLFQFGVLVLVTGLLWRAGQGMMGQPPIFLDTRVTLPFVPTQWFYPDLGALYLPFAFLVIIGTSNAVNLTDGLDGLAIGPTIVSSATFLVLAYLSGLVLTIACGTGYVDFRVAEYLNMPHVERTGELAVVCAAMVGSGFGFLWYNTFPATVFMGDVGSLALGGVLGTLAVLTKNEILSAIIHGVFLMEALSVMAQVGSFKLTGKRVFRMAPIHHHFELKGWAEPKIIVRFWIISIILALIGLVSIKLR